MRENPDQNNSEYGHFSRSAGYRTVENLKPITQLLLVKKIESMLYMEVIPMSEKPVENGNGLPQEHFECGNKLICFFF